MTIVTTHSNIYKIFRFISGMLLITLSTRPPRVQRGLTTVIYLYVAEFLDSA